MVSTVVIDFLYLYTCTFIVFVITFFFLLIFDLFYFILLIGFVFDICDCKVPGSIFTLDFVLYYNCVLLLVIYLETLMNGYCCILWSSCIYNVFWEEATSMRRTDWSVLSVFTVCSWVAGLCCITKHSKNRFCRIFTSCKKNV